MRVRRSARHLAIDLVLALKEVTRRKRRSAVGVAAVAFGVMALMLSAGFMEWIFWAMREGYVRSGLGHVQISRAGFQEGGRSDPMAFLLPAATPDIRALASPAEVETVAPRLGFSGLVSHGESTLSFQGEGLDPALEEPLARLVSITDGLPLAHEASSEILIGEGLAENLGVSVGDRVVLLVNTSSGGVNAVEATIRGLFSSGIKAYDDVTIRLPLTMARGLLRVDGATTWVLALKDTGATDGVVERLRTALPEDQFEVTAWYTLSDFYTKTVALFSRQLGVLDAIVVIIVLLTISNCMTIAVVERTGEIGTALALGATRRVMLRRFLVEGLVLGLVGALIGVVVGIAAARGISAVGIPMPAPPGMSRGYRGEILVTPLLVYKGLVLALASALVGALFPANRASRMEIVDAIRHGK